MKNYFILAISFFLVLIILSCSKDDNITYINPENLTATTQSTPCSQNLESMTSEESISIDCISNLDMQVINLPKNINIEYNGGKITNGTLHFNGGTIDGRILNQDLAIEGNVTLINGSYTLNPNDWNIKQGEVSELEAKNNLLNLQDAINQVKSMGGNTFIINDLDAYFDVNYSNSQINSDAIKESILVPSYFKLKMNDNSHLRVFPNSNKRYILIGFDNVFQSRVVGGHLHGDRDEHTYINNSEQGYLVEVNGSSYIEIIGVNMKYACGDGMNIQGRNFAFQSNYDPSEHILVTNCVFDSNRRNNLSITGGLNLVVQNSTFLNAGVDTANSNGTNPKYAIDIEPDVDNGTVLEIVDGLRIVNNVEKGSARGGFLAVRGNNIEFLSNKMETSINYTYASNTSIHNNTFNAKVFGQGGAITGGVQNSSGTGNSIYYNTIYGYGTGINTNGLDNNIYNNKINECNTAIVSKQLSDSQIHDNNIQSSTNNSRGISVHLGFLNNVDYLDNIINTDGNVVEFSSVNNSSGQENYQFRIEGNTIRNKNSARYTRLYKTVGATFNNNEIHTSIWTQASNDIKYLNNTIDGTSSNLQTLYFREGNQNIEVGNNTLIANKGTQATFNKPDQDPNEINEYGNTFLYR